MYDSVENTTDAGVTQLATVSNLTDDGSNFTVEMSTSAIPELSARMIFLPILGFSVCCRIEKALFYTKRLYQTCRQIFPLISQK